MRMLSSLASYRLLYASEGAETAGTCVCVFRMEDKMNAIFCPVSIRTDTNSL